MLRFKHKSVVSTFYLVPERLRNKANSPMFDPKKMLKNFMPALCLSCSLQSVCFPQSEVNKRESGTEKGSVQAWGVGRERK